MMFGLLRWLADLLRRFIEFNRELDRGMAVMWGEVEPGRYQKRVRGHTGSTAGHMDNPNSKGNA